MKQTILTLAAACGLQAAEFAATGPVKETKLEPGQFLGAVKVTFDLLPTTMSFDLPWHYCAVSENGLKFAHFAAETYDPREWDGTGADASFEAGMDKEGRYARVWIEHQSAARIVVKDWNQPEVGFRLELNGTALSSGVDYRFGSERTAKSKDLIIWLNKILDVNAIEDHRVEISIIPDRPKGN